MDAVHIKLYSKNSIRRFTVCKKIPFEEFKKTLKIKENDVSKISYLDNEEDWVSVSSENEWRQAVTLYEKYNSRVLKVKVERGFLPQQMEPPKVIPNTKENVLNKEEKPNVEEGKNPFNLNFQEIFQNINLNQDIEAQIARLCDIFPGLKGYVENNGGAEKVLEMWKTQFGNFAKTLQESMNIPEESPQQNQSGWGNWGNGHQQTQQVAPQQNQSGWGSWGNQRRWRPKQNSGWGHGGWGFNPFQWGQNWGSGWGNQSGKKAKQKNQNDYQKKELEKVSEEEIKKNFENELVKLAEMGFVDQSRNLKLLKEFSGDISLVSSELLK